MSGKNEVCLYCGAKLQKEQAFCSKCGTPCGEEKTMPCNQCGEKLKYGQKFCPRCGEKIYWDAAIIIDYRVHNFGAWFRRSRKAIVAIAASIALLTGLILVIYPLVFESVDDLCAKGQYQKAYERAWFDRKTEVWLENSAAVSMADIEEEVGDATIQLRSLYYWEKSGTDKEADQYLLLKIRMGSDTVGLDSSYAKDSNYLYMWDQKKHEWRRYSTGIEVEYLDSEIRRDGVKLAQSAVDRINVHYEDDRLPTIDLITP